MMQVIEQTHEEKMKMYMKCTKKKLAEMLIACNRILEAQLQVKNIAVQMETDVRKDWFMNQHFNEEQLRQIYDWEQKSGKVADVIPTEGGFNLHHIEDIERKIDLCFMKEEYMLRRWSERLGYKTSDGKTAKQFEEENGIKDEPIITGKEVWSEDGIFVTQFGEKRLKVLSNKYAVVAKRTASNAYDILFLDSTEYAEYLEKEKSKNHIEFAQQQAKIIRTD